MSSFYITTAIDYANGSPHLGHAYEKVLTDVIARLRRLEGQEVRFLTGLDEHGQKVQQTARKRGVEPQAFCDDVAGQFQNLCKVLGISNDDFIRTTEARHKDVVRGILQQLFDAGEIYQDDYHGYYSTRQEQFLQEKDMVDGQWPEIFGEVVEITEKNYFFKLSQYQDWLIDYIKTNEGFIFPRFRQKQVLEFLKEPLNDLCVSRPKERLEWGIPLPFDEDYVTYVWFDALVNYVSAAADNWPADIHVIGKDILVPPHAVYWPIMLKAAGLELPKTLLVHGWWNISGQKMSKTGGNVVDPFVLAGRFGPDALRYFFIREMNVGQDSDFSEEQFLARYNGDLANDLGNNVSRLLNMASRYTEGLVPEAAVDDAEEQELRKLWGDIRDEVIGFYDGMQFHKGLERLWVFVRGISQYLDKREPWKRAKSDDPQEQAIVKTSLALLAEAIRLTSVLITPVMPEISSRVHGLLGAEPVERWEGQLEWSDRLQGNSLGEKTILFPRQQAGE